MSGEALPEMARALVMLAGEARSRGVTRRLGILLDMAADVIRLGGDASSVKARLLAWRSHDSDERKVLDQALQILRGEKPLSSPEERSR